MEGKFWRNKRSIIHKILLERLEVGLRSCSASIVLKIANKKEELLRGVVILTLAAFEIGLWSRGSKVWKLVDTRLLRSRVICTLTWLQLWRLHYEERLRIGLVFAVVVLFIYNVSPVARGIGRSRVKFLGRRRCLI